MTNAPGIAPFVHLPRTRSRSHRKRFAWMATGFVFLGLHWLAATALLLWQVRPKGLQSGDYAVIAIAVAICGLYFWIAQQVHARRERVWNLSIGCAAFWALAFPTGTITAVLLVMGLVSSRHHFTH